MSTADSIGELYPIGISNFKEIILDDYVFVDKSLFIKKILNEGSKVVLITRPRRFGKTLNMSMLKYFFDITGAQANRVLFQHLQIAQASARRGEPCMDFQGKYPVIFLSLKSVKESTYELASQQIAELMSQLYKEHYILLNSDALLSGEKQVFQQIINQTAPIAKLENSLKNLIRYLSRHYQSKVMLLIDEYDTPVHSAYLSEPRYLDPMLRFMRVFFGEALKDNEFLQKAVITGILRIAQANLFSDLNNIDVYTLLRPDYEEYFGFTTDEVTALVSRTQGVTDLKGIQRWYNGYKIGDTVLYNPWSILCCLKQNGHLQPYWVETGGSGLLGAVLRKQDIAVKLQLQQLMNGETIKGDLDPRTVLTDMDHDPAGVWTLLVFAGYLNAQPLPYEDDEAINEGDVTCALSIPNLEVAGAYQKFVQRWYKEALPDGEYVALLTALIEGRVDRFQELLQDYIDSAVSYFDLGKKTPEKVYHVFVLGLLAGLRSRYAIHSNRESGFGRFDMLLIPKDKTKQGIIIEFKSIENESALEASAVEAIHQIQQGQYANVLKQHNIAHYLGLGIAFSGKRFALQSFIGET